MHFLFCANDENSGSPKHILFLPENDHRHHHHPCHLQEKDERFFYFFSSTPAPTEDMPAVHLVVGSWDYEPRVNMLNILNK